MLKSPLFWRLYLAYALCSVLSITVIAVLFYNHTQSTTMDSIKESLAARTLLLENMAQVELKNYKRSGNINTELQTKISLLGNKIETRLSLISVSGAVIADSSIAESSSFSYKNALTSMGNHIHRPEVLDSAYKPFGISQRYSDSLQQQMLYYAKAVYVDSKLHHPNRELVGYVRTALSLADIDIALNKSNSILLTGAIISTLVALFLGAILIRYITYPLIKMASTANTISQGHYRRRLQILRQDEIGVLAQSFNRMAQHSERRVNEITDDRNKLAAILSGMSEGLIALDEHQKIIHINEAAAKIIGRSPQRCLNQPIWQAIHLREINEALQLAAEKQSIINATMRLPYLGADMVINIHVATLSNEQDKSVGAVIVLNDISERDQLEKMRRDFVANASHELKTPITAIKGIIETLIDDPEMPKETSNKFLSRVKAQSSRLSTLVSDLLTLSRLESEHISGEFHPFDFRAVVNASCRSFNSFCEEKSLILDTQVPEQTVMISGNQSTLAQAIDNLIDNAIKYSHDAGKITVSLSTTDTHCLLKVKDTGLGISKEDQIRIFERFYRVDKARSTELGGTGLGLSIVKHIVIEHNGDISIDSILNKETTFTISIPRL